ncbi:MAG TPA: CHAT domain-containing protein [Thermoanaerobaculia bacterium]|nr:CHAT domain-containing protein [Thermoanaerobaculia bacterium]
MTSVSERNACPDVETLALFAEGRLEGARRTEVIAHLDSCEECMTQVALAMKADTRERGGSAGRFRFRWTAPQIAAAVAAAIVLISAPLLWKALSRREPGIERLVELAPRSARAVEPRLTGGFAWVAYRGGPRAGGGTVDAEKMRLTGVAGELAERAAREGTAEARHAAGVAMVLVQEPEAAIPHLEAVTQEENDAKAWSDLAAARFAAAADLQRPSLYPEALAAADRALRIEPGLAEALFNRALVLERLLLFREARLAWERYLEVDASSEWAAEARARLAELPAATSSSRFEHDRPLAERAAARGDPEAVRKLVAAHRARARAFAETEYLGRWGDVDDENLLNLARTIGAALAENSGETMVRESVAAIDRASPADRGTLAEGHAAYRRARIAYSRHQVVEARRELLRAAELLERGNDPLALAARYYAASARLASHDVAGARAELEALRDSASSGYTALGAHIRWELGRTYVLDDDPAAAIPILREGAALFRRAGDRAGEAFVESMLASALAAMGSGDDGWSARIRAFEALSREGDPHLLTASLGAAKRAELLAGRRDAALALGRLETLAVRTGARPVDVLDALVYQSMLESAAGNGAEALHAAREAASVAAGIGDPAVRARAEADAAVATGAALAIADPRGAMAPLSRAIGFYREHELPLALPEPLLLRARCAARNGDAAGAWGDLQEGIGVVERSRKEARNATLGTGALQVAEGLFEEAMRLALDRGDAAGAFALAERARGGSVTAGELQRRLAGSGAVMLQIVTLAEETIVLAVNDRGITAARRPETRKTLAALAKRSVEENGTASAGPLYDALIRPVEGTVTGARQLIVVADRHLQAVPFAALYDRAAQQYLIERMPVAIAANASALQRQPAPRGKTLTAMALLSGGSAGQSGLPAATDEIREVLGMYPQVAALPRAATTFAALSEADADVLHIAGHTNEEPGGGDRALFLTGPAGGVERVSWKTMAAVPRMRPRIVVLAACETLREPASPQTRAPSLGGAFSAAGAADVIGTLAKILDRDARMLFEVVHRELAAGAEPAEALRTAQMLAIGGNGSREWRTIALLTRRIPAPAH